MKDLTRRGFVGLGVAAAAALTGCLSSTPTLASAPSPASSSSRQESSSVSDGEALGSGLRFVTGGQSGTYYRFGQLLAQHATDNAGITVTALVSDGSKANVEYLEDGLAEFGFCQSDVMAYAYGGENLFEGAPLTSFSAVASLYDEYVQIVTCDPAIEAVADLEGKRVSIGAPNSGAYFNAIDVLGAYGISESDITPTYQSFGDAADSLKSGQIDAAFVVAGIPTAAIDDLFASKAAYLVALDDSHIDDLVASSPYYMRAVIPAGTYAGQREEVATAAVSAVVIAADTVPDDDVYAFVSDIFDGARDSADTSAHSEYAELNVGKGASVTSVPYHPGAARYFEEKGFAVEAKAK